jgi:hypothetical protein
MRTSSTSLLGACVASIVLVGLCGDVLAQDSRRVLSVPFPEVGQVCLDKDQTADVTRDIKNLVLPAGSSITLIAYSDKTEIAGRRSEEKAPCVNRAIPVGIGDHERIALLRALQLVEIADKLGVSGFSGTPMLVVSADTKYRHAHSQGIAIIAQRSAGSGPNERRVEIWATPGADSAVASSGGGGGQVTVLTPILLPPSSYAGGAQQGSAPATGASPTLRDETGLSGWQWLGWSLVGGGTALGIAGVFAVLSGDNYENRSREELDRTRSIAFQDRADERYRDAGWSIGIGSGLAVLGGALLLSLPSDDEAPESISLGTAPLPGGGLGFVVGVSSPSW